MPDKVLAEGAAALYAAGGSVLTMLGRAAIDRLAKRDKLAAEARLKKHVLRSAQEEREINRVWARLEKVEEENRELNTRLDECQDGHRKCESNYDALMVRFAQVERSLGIEPTKGVGNEGTSGDTNEGPA